MQKNITKEESQELTYNKHTAYAAFCLLYPSKLGLKKIAYDLP